MLSVDRRALLGIAALVVVWGAAWIAFAVTRGGPPGLQSTVAVAAAFDFVVTAGLALYLIAVRPKRLPRWVLGAAITIGFLFARLVLGAAARGGQVVMVAFLFAEVALVAMLVVRVRHARRAWRLARVAGEPRFEALTAALVAARFPRRLAAIAATEVTLVGSAIVGWRAPTGANRFTVHRVNGWPLYAGVLVFLIAVESIAVHVALAAYVSPIVAWIATASSIYMALWFIGDVHALRHGGVKVLPRGLEIEVGVRWRGRVPWAQVSAIEPVEAAPATALDASVLGANTIVRLRAPVRFSGMFGRARDATEIALSIDERDAFVIAARAAMLAA